MKVKEIKERVLSELAEKKAISTEDLEAAILRGKSEAEKSALLTRRKNGSTNLLNLLAWAKIGLKREGKIEYTKTSIILKREAQDEPTANPDPSNLRVVEELIQATQAYLEKLISIKEGLLRPPNIPWAPDRPPKPVKRGRDIRAELERLSETIKENQAKGQLPKGSINAGLRSHYAKTGHKELKTITEWKSLGMVPKKGTHALLLWRKTKNGRFLPLRVFSRAQIQTNR